MGHSEKVMWTTSLKYHFQFHSNHFIYVQSVVHPSYSQTFDRPIYKWLLRSKITAIQYLVQMWGAVYNFIWKKKKDDFDFDDFEDEVHVKVRGHWDTKDWKNEWFTWFLDMFLNYTAFSLRLLSYQYFILDNLSNQHTQFIYFQGLPGPKGDKVPLVSFVLKELYAKHIYIHTHAHTQDCFILFPISASQQADVFWFLKQLTNFICIGFCLQTHVLEEM